MLAWEGNRVETAQAPVNKSELGRSEKMKAASAIAISGET